MRVLAIGAHCDDIEIGAGGTLARLARQPGTQFHFEILTSTHVRAAEARAALTELAAPCATTIRIDNLPDSRLPTFFNEVKDRLGALAKESWDLVLTHCAEDAHQDHRMLGRLAPTAFRNHLIAHFEIPKWDGDLGAMRANAFVPLSEEEIVGKWRLIWRHYVSQRDHDWFDDETIRSLARLRGMECRSRYAEALRIDKFLLDVGTSHKARMSGTCGSEQPDETVGCTDME